MIKRAQTNGANSRTVVIMAMKDSKMDWPEQDKRNNSIVISRIAEGDNESYTDLPDEVVNLLNNVMVLKALQKSVNYVTQLRRG
jgi:mannitol/fructose-specific phosphotransferase system IIA component (Ntr-type)